MIKNYQSYKKLFIHDLFIITSKVTFIHLVLKILFFRKIVFMKKTFEVMVIKSYVKSNFTAKMI